MGYFYIYNINIKKTYKSGDKIIKQEKANSDIFALIYFL